MSHDLAAILAADVVGYDGLATDGPDAATVFLSDFDGILAKHVDRHHGRVEHIGTEGHYLTKFSSALEAVGCAVDVQRDIAARKKTLPVSDQMGLRIGVKHEDLGTKAEAATSDGGDSVLRLVALAAPGGICISRTIYDEVRFQFDLDYDTATDPKQTVYVCQEIRQKWNELNLLELSAVKIPPSALLSQPEILATARLAFNEAKGLIRRIRTLLDRSARE